MRFSPLSITSTIAIVFIVGGCADSDNQSGRLDRIWGVRGMMPGQFEKPRAIAIDANDRIYLVDMRAKIQAFDADGAFLFGWQTPTHKIGRPSGLAIDHEGNLLVADSHYHQILVYDPKGKPLRALGGERELLGNDIDRPLIGEFGYIGDLAVDSKGNLYVAEAQLHERISKFSPDGKLLKRWGGRGPDPGQFLRIRALAFDADDRLYVADACNNRVQVFDEDGNFISVIGRRGSALGELEYPYDVVVAPDETIYVCEYGNNRVQRFTREGASLGIWGKSGRGEGELYNPWAVGVDSRGRVYVVDSNNHRVQRVIF